MAVGIATAAYASSSDMDTPDSTACPRVLIHTTAGDITVELYNDTPIHRDNFLKLASEGYYDGVLFHRVVPGFVVQGGDRESVNAAPGQHLGSGTPGYTLEAEIRYPKHFHKHGALAAARATTPTPINGRAARNSISSPARWCRKANCAQPNGAPLSSWSRRYSPPSTNSTATP